MKNIPSQQKQQAARTYIENEDIRCVASPYPTTSSSEGIITPVLPTEMKPVVLERLEKEIISKIGGSICRRSVSNNGINNLSGKKRRREGEKSKANGSKAVEGRDIKSMSVAETVVRSRFVVGINQCTRMLERTYQQQREGQPKQQPKSGSKPTTATPALILLSRDVRPATVLAHISIYARMLNIPTLILPGKASVELGKAVGVRSVAVAAFLSAPRGESGVMLEDKQQEREWKENQNEVDSFIKYVVSKIPK